MFGLLYGEKLDPDSRKELELLTQGLKRFLLTDHNEDGSHRLGIWTPYAPVWRGATTQPAIGNGSILGKYARSVNTIDFKIDIQFGSTTTYGTGTWLFGLPVASRIDSAVVGHMLGVDGGTTYYTGVVTFVEGMSFVQLVSDAGPWTVSVPITWASGDAISIQGRYEVLD